MNKPVDLPGDWDKRTGEVPEAPAAEGAQPPGELRLAEMRRQRDERRALARSQFLHMVRNEPPPLDFLWPGFLRGTVGAIVAAGSTGKSFMGLELALCVAHRLANLKLLKMDITEHGRVTIFNAEDPEAIIWQRLHAIAKRADLDAQTWEEIADNIYLVSWLGRMDTDLTKKEILEEAVIESEGSRLIVFDTFNRFSGGASENDNAIMGLYMKSFEHIAKVNDAGTLFMHHTAKTMSVEGRQDEQEAARGASSITSNIRWQGFMQTMTKDEVVKYAIDEETRKQYVKFGGSKENYGSSTGERWYERAEGGVLVPIDLAGTTAKRKADQKIKGRQTA